MAEQKAFAVVQLHELRWPISLEVPSRRFRLFVAGNVREASVDMLSQFASAALSRGMVYFCAWGPGCERFHDIVDEVVVEDSVREHKFAGPSPSDTIMTTWHEEESLEEALDFFSTSAIPSDGFVAGSDFRLVLHLDHPEWGETASRVLESPRASSR